MSGLTFLAALAALPSLANAYSFEFTSRPTQCQDLSLKITGTGGKPPYQLLLIPFGPNPLPSGKEARRITTERFPDNQDTLSFKLPFPANSQFIAVVSDASGFGTGGTSAAAVVAGSSENTCFDSSKSVEPAFVFNIDPPNSIVQCQATRIWWNKDKVQGNTQFQGVIPGGQSFTIPVGVLSDAEFKGTGFNWTVNVRSSTAMLLVAGDERGMGSAGSADYTVGAGLNPNNDCINDNSPSSTPGQPAGGSYATSPAGRGSGHGSPTNVGAIVGGVIGGVTAIVIIILVALFFFRRQRLRQSGKERPVDLFQDDEGEDHPTARTELPQYYEPEPFIVPDPTIRSSEDDPTENRPLSMMTSSIGHDGFLGHAAPTMTAGSSTGRKSAAGPRQYRAVNIIQHDDAGPSEQPKEAEEVETVELPPAYTNIRQ